MFGLPASLTIDGVSQSLATTPANANEYDDGLLSSGLSITLPSGAHDIVLSVDNTGMKIPFPLPPTGPIFAQFRWSSYDETRQAAIDAAKTAKLVLLFANEPGGDSTGIATTATNILSSLDSNQDELIDSIAAVNPKTLVVLQNGQPVTMPWLAKIPAVLETWYPGQEGGYATANVLLGKVNPAGKLPVTFPAKVEDTPFSGLYAERVGGAPDPSFCGATEACGKVTWSEGLLMGYRWYDAEGIAPMFAFGEGLSYTTFAYSNVKAVAVADGIDVTFTVKNTGSVAGDAVPQVYLAGSANVPAGILTAKKSLVGFERVPLAAREAKSVTVHIAPRQLSVWSSAEQSWVPVTGSRTVHVSTSSRDTDVIAVAEVVVP
jgi:beta-glucosidase